jgi:hypothetical protein
MGGKLMMQKNNNWFIMGLTALLLLTTLTAAMAQETTGGIKVYVKDQQGLVIPGATVELSSPALIQAKSLPSDQAGYAFFQQLPPGEYALSAVAPGFQTQKVTGIALSAGNLPTFELSLKIGEVSQTIEVVAAAVLQEVTTSNVATTIPLNVIDNSPKGRSYQTLIGFAPGARQEPLQSSRTDRGRANGFQIDGASDSENAYLVEGLDTSEIQSGGIKTNVVFEFIQEVQVKTSGLAAEYGGATGGVVNVVQKRGGNVWHGGLVTHFQTSKLDSSNKCATTPQPSPSTTASGTQINCGLRQNPSYSINTSTRTDAPYEYYIQKKLNYSVVEPGYQVGGPIFKDKLWIFSSYIPTVDRTSQTQYFTGTNPGPRTFYRSSTTHNMFNRLDYQPLSKLRLYAGWTYNYNRIAGQLPLLPDSAYGQVNGTNASDPTTFRSDRGSVNPGSIFTFGGDWTITPRALLSARYGYFYYNTTDRGMPAGVRYTYEFSLGVGSTTDPNGNVLIPTANSTGSSSAHAAGFANLAGNQQTLFDVFSRKQFSADFSYNVSKWGTHNFKAGYSQNQLHNDVSLGYNTAWVRIYWGDAYTPVTGTPCPSAILSANNGACRGKWGYYTIMDGINTAGIASSKNHGLYFQDSWTIGRGLTINPGIRFDKEYLPPYSEGYPSISFGFGEKAALRLGAAYDLFQNGKVKIFGDYAKFYDVMKFSLPRGSFGGEYWHDCTYTMDTYDYTTITPSAPGGHACGPAPGPAPGVTSGTFIEHMNWRAAVPPNKIDPGVDPNVKPMSQHETIVGFDWAINNNMEFEARYARKRLDNTIEDMAIDDNTYYIGNPGTAFSDLLRRPLPSAGYPNVLCASCPSQPKAVRRYDGLETRFTYRHGSNWFAQVNYTFSRLHGNYSGLTDTDIADANGGRHNANNNRSFDLPETQYTTSGKVTDGPLGTDRPNVLTMNGYYIMKWWGMATRLGLTQMLAQGSPKSTCVPVYDSTSSCQYWDQRGTFANIHRDAATGNLVLDSVEKNARGPKFVQTDLNIGQDFNVSKSNEEMKLSIEMNVTNLFNNNTPLVFNPNPFASTNEWLKFPSTANDAGTDFKAMMSGYDPIQRANAEAAAGISTLIYNNRYGKPLLFQNRRTIRLSVNFNF